jgi:hypothetical protein
MITIGVDYLLWRGISRFLELFVESFSEPFEIGLCNNNSMGSKSMSGEAQQQSPIACDMNVL